MILFILTLIYFVINIGVLLWFWIDPDGFWGFVWFYTLLTGMFYLLYVGLMALSAIFTGKKGWKRWVYGILFGVLAIVLIGIEQWPVFYLSKKLSDKYQYIEKSSRYFKQGKYEKAYDYSADLYERSLKDYSRFWFLRYLFLQTETGEEFLKERQYNFKLNYAFCLTRLGLKPDKAEQVFKECEKIARTYLPDRADYLLLALGGRSNLYYRQGEIIKSERVYNKIFGQLQGLKNEDRIFMVNTMLIRVMHLKRHGDYAKAHQTIEEALDLYDLDEEEPESGTFLQLAMAGVQSYLLRGEVDKARALITKAEPAARDRKRNISYLKFLALKGRLLEARGLPDESEETYREMVERSSEKSEVVYSEDLLRLATFYFRQDKHHEALKYFQKSAQHSPDDRSEMRLRNMQKQGISLANFALGEYDEAVSLMKSVDASYLSAIDDYLQVLESGQKEKYLLKVQSHFELANALYLASPNGRMGEHVYNNVLFTKSLAFFSNRHIEKFLDETQNQELKRRMKRKKKKKKALEEQRLKHFPENERLHQEIDSLALQERKLMDELTTLKGYESLDPSKVTWEEVRASLDSGEVAIEILNCPETPLNPDTEHYYACIVEKNSVRPEVAPLFNASTLDKLLETDKGGKQHVNSLYQGNNRDRLYDLIFKPLSPALKDKNKVYLSLSGRLHQVSMPALTIDEPYEIELVTSTRTLVGGFIEKADRTENVVMMGDLEYDDGTRKELTASLEKADNESSSQRDKEKKQYQNLPGTKKELKHIAQLLSKEEISGKIISGKDGTEAKFRDMGGVPADVIHLATHGFYYPPANSVVMMDRLFGVENYLSDIENPMLRSGLLFSKPNEKAPSLEQDGIMTANEISAMDFSGVDLVVLSACQSGLGDVMGSEGVFGLQRAFKMAGVEKLIVSLWKVPDEATAELMAKFYDHYLAGDDANKALRKAQMAVRKKYVEPFYWAGFCVVN